MAAEPIRVLLIDDHPVVLAGYRRLLETASDITVAVEVETGEAGYTAHVKHRPDVDILDLSLPGRSGLEVMRRILVQDPEAKILIVSVYDNDVFVRRARDAGARGFLGKRSAPAVLLDATRRIAAGGTFFPDESNARPEPLTALSPREFEVFRLLAEGNPVADIAKLLHISPKTAGVHYTRVMRKLAIDNLAQLTRLALRHGIILP